MDHLSSGDEVRTGVRDPEVRGLPLSARLHMS